MSTRRERVVLELDDQFTGQLARAAAASELFQKSLGKTHRESDRTSSALTRAERDTQKFSATISRSTRDLDSYSGRLGLLASSLGALGPAAIPVTAVAIPAVTGLAQQLGFAALAGGTAVLAFQGVGDALEAMNKAHLDPTTANLEKAEQAMARLSPAAQDLVTKLGSMREELGRLKDAAGSGILPGATAAIDDLEKRLPIVERILRQISAATGDALQDGAASLAGPEWDDFFHFIATEARPELTKLAKSIGNVAHGAAEMWVAFGPLNSDFSSWMLRASRDFNAWATGLSKTQGFADFVAYIRETGPQVGEALGAIGNALVQIVQAAAPVGGPVLEAITALADVISAIADSPLGTPIFGLIAAFSAASLAAKAWSGVAGSSVGKFVADQGRARMALLATVSAQERATMSASAMATRQAAGRRAMVGMGAQAAVLGLMMTGVTDKLSLNNTAMLGLAGSMAGPWGAAAGAAIGLTMDLTKVNDGLADSIDRASTAAQHPEGLKQLVAARKELVDQFADVANDDSGWFGYLGKQRRMVSFLSGDVGQTKDAIADLDGAISHERAQLVMHKNELGLTSRGYELATASAEDFRGMLQQLEGLLSKRSSMRDYQAALDALTDGIKENGHSLDVNTEKGRANQANLDNIAVTAMKVAENMTGSNRIKFLTQARQDILDAGSKLKGGKRQAELLTRELERLNAQSANPHVDIDTTAAIRKINTLRAAMDALTGRHSGDLGQGLGVLAPTRNPASPQYVAPISNADGGFISGPGGPREDRIPAWLSNGEFVVNAAATAQNRGLLEHLNAKRFADGGQVGALSTYARTGDHGVGDALDHLKKASEGAAKALEQEKQKRENLLQARGSLTSSVTDAFRSDVFAPPADVWSAGELSWKQQLQADIKNARKFTAQIARLKNKGLDGAALAAIASTGSTQVAGQFAHMSRHDLAAYERLYNVRERVSHRAGAQAGEAVFGERIDALNDSIRESNHRLHRIEQAIKHDGPKATGAEVAKGVNGAATKGTRDRRHAP